MSSGYNGVINLKVKNYSVIPSLAMAFSISFISAIGSTVIHEKTIRVSKYLSLGKRPYFDSA